MQYDSAPHQFSRTVISSHYLFWTFRPFMSTSWWEMTSWVVSLLVYLTWTDSRRQRQPKRPPARILMQYHKTWNHHHLVYLILLQFLSSFLPHSKIIKKGCIGLILLSVNSNNREISKSVRHFIRHSTTSQRWSSSTCHCRDLDLLVWPFF